MTSRATMTTTMRTRRRIQWRNLSSTCTIKELAPAAQVLCKKQLILWKLGRMGIFRVVDLQTMVDSDIQMVVAALSPTPQLFAFKLKQAVTALLAGAAERQSTSSQFSPAGAASTATRLPCRPGSVRAATVAFRVTVTATVTATDGCPPAATSALGNAAFDWQFTYGNAYAADLQRLRRRATTCWGADGRHHVRAAIEDSF